VPTSLSDRLRGLRKFAYAAALSGSLRVAPTTADEGELTGPTGNRDVSAASVSHSEAESAVAFLGRLGADTKTIKAFAANARKGIDWVHRPASPEERSAGIRKGLDVIALGLAGKDERVRVATTFLLSEMAKGDEDVAVAVLKRYHKTGPTAKYWLFAGLASPLGRAAEGAESDGTAIEWSRFRDNVSWQAKDSPSRYADLQAAAEFAGQYALHTGDATDSIAALTQIVALPGQSHPNRPVFPSEFLPRHRYTSLLGVVCPESSNFSRKCLA